MADRNPNVRWGQVGGHRGVTKGSQFDTECPGTVSGRRGGVVATPLVGLAAGGGRAAAAAAAGRWPQAPLRIGSAPTPTAAPGNIVHTVEAAIVPNMLGGDIFVSKGKKSGHGAQS